MRRRERERPRERERERERERGRGRGRGERPPGTIIIMLSLALQLPNAVCTALWRSLGNIMVGLPLLKVNCRNQHTNACICIHKLPTYSSATFHHGQTNGTKTGFVQLAPEPIHSILGTRRVMKDEPRVLTVQYVGQMKEL